MVGRKFFFLRERPWLSGTIAQFTRVINRVPLQIDAIIDRDRDIETNSIVFDILPNNVKNKNPD